MKMKLFAALLLLVAAVIASASNIVLPKFEVPTIASPTLSLDLPKPQAVAPASGWGGSIYYDIRDHLAYTVVQKPLTTIKDVQLGKIPKFSLDVDLFAGIGVKNGEGIAGFDISRTWHVAANADFMLGVGFAIRQGDNYPSSTGPMAGVHVSF